MNLSIFSFKLKNFKGLYFGIFLLLAFDVLVFRSNFIYKVMPDMFWVEMIQRKEKEIERYKHISTLILGDSRGLNGLNPYIIDKYLYNNKNNSINVFNASFFSVTPKYQYLFLKKNIKKLPHLKLIICQTSLYALNSYPNALVHNEVDTQIRYLCSFKDRMLADKPIDYLMGYFWKLYDFKTDIPKLRSFIKEIITSPENVLLQILAQYFSPHYNDYKSNCYASLGWRRIPFVFNATQYNFFEKRHALYKNYQLQGTMLEYLKKLILFCKKNNIRIVFTRLPVTELYKKFIFENYYKENILFDQVVGRICKKNNIPYCNLFYIKLKNKYFCDMQHVNYEGAAYLSVLLCQEIKKKM